MFFGIVILLILIVNFSFILAEEFKVGNEVVSFDAEKVNYKTDGNGEATFLFYDDGGFVEIKENKFENILPATKSLNPSYIKFDVSGKIIQADLTANEKGSVFLINGINFEAPPNSRVYYDKNGFYLENIKVSEIEENKFIETPIEGKNVNLFDELTFSYGKVIFNEDRYLVEYGSMIYDNMEISSGGGILIAKNPLMDLSNYKGDWIQKTKNGLNIQSVKDDVIELIFLEGSEIFEIDNKDLSPNVEHSLFMSVSDGDKLEITKKDSLLKGMPPLIKHKSSGQKTTITREGESVGSLEEGQTIIKNGRHIFKFKNGKYLSELGNLNTKNKLSISFNLDSDILKDKSINVDDENGYSIYEPKTGENIFTFDKTLLSAPNYNFESEIGKKIYSFAENQVGDSAFVWGGRGNVYYDEEKGNIKEKVPVCGVKVYDCIGLPLTFLPKVYPENSLKDFPPNLQLVETLEKKGWSSSIIEPINVAGQKIAEDSVKNIPPGSIVFLMGDYGGSRIPEGFEGIDYQKYINSKNEKVYLNLGHTLIRGTGEKNFINAYPNTPEKELPKLAREYNKYW